MNLDIARVVETPVAPPYRCATCPSTGPQMFDTGVDIGMHGRLYLCKSCARDITRLFGWTSGKKMEELASANLVAKKAQETQKEMEEMIHDLTEALKTKDLMVKSLESQLETTRGELTQAQHISAEIQRNVKELVKG